MYHCPITYLSIEEKGYSPQGLKLLHKNLKGLKPLPFDRQSLLQEAVFRSDKMSVQGVQPKLSATLSLKDTSFIIVDQGGDFILKPPNVFPELPENEAITMHLASIIGIKVPICGLLYAQDNTLVYFIKRFDRLPSRKRLAVEDFAQLMGKSRETKYDASVETIISVIDRYCTFPAIEKAEFFKRFIFNYLIGNEDMHIKNYSLIENQEKYELAPAYDFVNSAIALGGKTEESALSLKGKKSNLTYNILIDYLGKERLSLNNSTIDELKHLFKIAIPKWEELIEISFLSAYMKTQYINLLCQRARLLRFI